MNMKQKAFLPYIEGTTDRIGKLLRKFNIKTVYNAPHKISHSLVKVKDKLPHLQSAGIYMIPCSCGLKYIRQTGRTVEDRRKEHIRLCKYGPYEKSAIALHSADSGHAIEFDNIKIIDKEENLYRRLVKEAFHIEQHLNNINKDEGLQLSNSWGSLFQDHTQKREARSPHVRGAPFIRTSGTIKQIDGGKPDAEDITKFENVYELLDKFLEGQEWVAGSNITVADYSIVVSVSITEAMGYDISKYQNVARWFSKAKKTMVGFSEIEGKGNEEMKKMIQARIAGQK
ncbi:hypothetical protein ANN_15652 [Periplaneta americana]|uniref:GST C-terminal domain-containing protein n=1 Tax=Periplaneta americana TaxID=6978 RepID=A0ABQ8SGX9_PERAM|nr:hypothetical protein ANN_15652 [Periplaneta americana]